MVSLKIINSQNRDFASSNIHTEMRKLCRENISDNENNIVAGLRSTVRDMTRFAVPKYYY